MPIRCTFFFEAAKYGWSETFYSASSTVELAMVEAQRLVPKRVDCLAFTANMIGVRVSNDDPPLDSLFYQVPVGDGLGTSALGSADIPNTCLDVRLEATAAHRRAYQMRGIPDRMVTDSGHLSPDPDFSRALNRFSSLLITPAWGMRIRNPASAAVQILTMTNLFSSEIVQITTAVPHGFTTNNPLVYISGRSNVQGFNGIWRARSTGASSFEIHSSRPVGPFFTGLFVRQLSYSFAAFSNFIPERASHRITGGPFGKPVGKRKARSLR